MHNPVKSQKLYIFLPFINCIFWAGKLQTIKLKTTASKEHYAKNIYYCVTT